MKVRLSSDAKNFLRREVRYLRRHSSAAANRLLATMDEVRSNLASFPLMGSGEDQFPVPGSRRLVVGDYVLTYDVDDDLVSITSIRHGRMRPSLPRPSTAEDDL